jgi:hypothetical protein
MSKKIAAKKFRFNKNQIIGTPDAESDRFLDKVFVDNGVYETLKDVDNPKCILIGRTDSGKSALLKRLEEEQEKVKRIDPESMSLKYLSNSTILSYLRSIDVNLNFFYKVLWKHVFIVEILKLYLDENDVKKKSMFQMLGDKIRNKWGNVNPNKQKAIKYLESWTDEFWLKTEYRIKTLENTLEEKITASTGIVVKPLTAGIAQDAHTTNKATCEIKTKAEQIISESQATELYDVIQILRDDIFVNSQKKFFIIIDDLDKEWVSPQIVYDLIAAMIEVIKEFTFFEGVKIVIALRENLHQLIFSGKTHRGGQREKFSSLYLHLDWETDDLRTLFDKRIRHITNDDLSFATLFERESKNKVTGWQYIIERSYMRPRDIISYTNKIIENANNKTLFNANIIRRAEMSYSIERLHALEDEWDENFGEFSKACNFLIGMHNGFNVMNVKEEPFVNIYLEKDYINNFKGELLDLCKKWKIDKIDFKNFIKELLFILYRIGIIGVKLRPDTPIQFFYHKGFAISPNDFVADTKIYVHKALYSVFKINTKEQEVDYLN